MKRRGNTSKTAAVALTLLLLIVNMASVFALGPPGPTFFINVSQFTQKVNAGEYATYNVDLTAWTGQFNVTVGLAERRRADWQQLSPLPAGVEVVYPKQIYIKTGSENYRFPVVVKIAPDLKESTVDVEILVVGRYGGGPIGILANIRLYVVPRVTSLGTASTVFYEGFDKWNERGGNWIVNSKGGSVGMYDPNDPGIDYPGTPSLGWSMYHPYASLKMTKNFLDYSVGAEHPIPRLNGSFILEFAMRPDEKRMNFTFDLTDTLQNTGIYAEMLDGNLAVQGQSYGTYSTTQWYKFRFENNATSPTIQWYLNGKYMDSLPFTGAPDTIKTAISGSGVGTGYVDDIFLQKTEVSQPTSTTVLSNNTASTTPWLSGWNYRKSHTINSAPNAGNNYQIEIVAHRGNGVDYDRDVYLNGRSLNWPNDIRFTGKDGITELNYWLQDSSTNTATFWVKVKDDLSYSSATIYIYYGRLCVSSASNLANTFIDTDDFEGDAEGQAPSGWIIGAVTISVQSNSAYVQQGSKGLEAVNNGNTNPSYRNITTINSDNSHAIEFWGKVITEDYNYYQYYDVMDNSGDVIILLAFRNLASSIQYYDGANNGWVTLQPYIVNTWYHFKIYNIDFTNQQFDVDIDGVNRLVNGRFYTNGASLSRFGIDSGDGTTQKDTFDTFLTRKYVSPEPNQGSWGREEATIKGTGYPSGPLTEWNFRKPHVIKPALNAGSNYQVKIIVHRGSGADSDENVYLNGKSLSWPNDIRFTGSDGVTDLNYWLEGSDSNTAVFWVKVRDDLSTRGATIYVYYSRPNALSASNGGDTFEFFDDFSDSTLDTNKWSIQSASTSLSNSILTVTNPSTTFSGIRSAERIDLSNWRAVEAKVKWDPVSEANHFSFGLFDTAGPTIWWNGYSTHYYAYLSSPDNNVYVYVCDGDCDARSTIIGGYDNNWHRLKIAAKVGYEPTLWWDGSPYHIDRNLAGTTFYFWPAKAYDELNKQIQIDWVFIRKLAPTEPSQGGWGREEKISEQATTRTTSINTVTETTTVTSISINTVTITQSTTVTSTTAAISTEQANEPLTSAWAIGATITALALVEVLLLKRTRRS